MLIEVRTLFFLRPNVTEGIHVVTYYFFTLQKEYMFCKTVIVPRFQYIYPCHI